MTAMSQETRQQICTCDPLTETKTYYVWLLTNEKQMVSDVVELYVTTDELVLEKHSHETVIVPRHDVFMVTCDVCSPPPCN
jgi:hypothetical protein